MAVWVRDVNARGGLACHPVVLYQRDDGADPSRSSAEVQELVQHDHVIALVGAFVPLSMTGFSSAVTAHHVPVVGGDSLAFDWQTNPNLYLQGGGLSAQIAGMLNRLVAQHKTKLGLLYCVEASTCSLGSKLIAEEAKKAGADLVYSSPVSITQTDYTAQCQNAKAAGVQVLGTAMDGASIARVARSCASLGYYPQLAASAGVLGQEQARDPAIQRDTLATSSVNVPWMLDDTPGQRVFHRALRTYGGAELADCNAIAAWAAGKLMEATVDALGAAARTAPLTTELIRTGLTGLHNETLDGLAPPLNFTADRKEPPVHCVYFEVDTTAGWIAPDGSKPVCP
jgi:branched-chain amino acid transport system substrate-binding protein